MSDTRVFTLTYKHSRSVMMLYALHTLNNEGTVPTITELARAYDVRRTIPTATLQSRRKMVNAMVRAGFIAVHHVDDKDRNRYQITPAGSTELARVWGVIRK